MRQRIVINLDAPKTGGVKPVRKRRRWPRVLAILALLVLIVAGVAAVGGYMGWRRYQSTPTYTLALMFDAAQRNDPAEFQKRIDEEEIAKNMAASVSEKAAGRYGFALNTSVQQRLDSAMPSLLPRVKQTIHDEIFQEMKQFATATGPRTFISILSAVQSLMTVVTQGDTAKATGAMAGRTVEMTMRRDADRWKVIDIKDDVIVQRVVDSVMKELPAIGATDSPGPFLKQWSAKPRRKRQR